jgi:hypothetical protein
MTLNRRTFQIGLLLGIGASALPPWAKAQSVQARTPVYRHRLRFTRRGRKLDFWVRVANVKDISADVPFTLQISSDAAGKKVLKAIPHVSLALSSHISRGRIDLTAVTSNFRSPLYGRVIFANGKASKKVRQINSQAETSRA